MLHVDNSFLILKYDYFIIGRYILYLPKLISSNFIFHIVPTEYDYIQQIGTTYETSQKPHVKKLNNYFHQQQTKTVFDLIQKMQLDDYNRVIDLGCSDGGWLNDYKAMKFCNVVGIDISSERAEKAKKRGYSETFVTNAYNLPFENGSELCIICNGMIVHVINDSDRLKIFREVKRVLKKNGIFILNFANARARGLKTDSTKEYCRLNTIELITKLVKESGLSIEHIKPGYYIYPRLGANRKITSISTKFLFPITNYFLKKFNNINLAEVIYLGVRKK